MDFAVGAVDEHRFGSVPDDHQVLKILEITIFGQAVEILVTASQGPNSDGRARQAQPLRRKYQSASRCPSRLAARSNVITQSLLASLNSLT